MTIRQARPHLHGALGGARLTPRRGPARPEKYGHDVREVPKLPGRTVITRQMEES